MVGVSSTDRRPAPSIAYQPALDGVRALAVAVVLLFHGEIGGFGGGYLGVSVFFTLSGFLITTLLSAEYERDGRIDVGRFYTRRARRLLPASVLVVLVVVVASATTDWFDGVADLRAHAVGSLLQVANWVFLINDGSYQDLLQQAAGATSPLEHYWSLAIEEQFYWMWPVAFGLIWRAGRSPRGRLWLLVGATALFAAVAPFTAVVWGGDAAYWASPARASEILIGAVLAAFVAHRGYAKEIGAGSGGGIGGVGRHLWSMAAVALSVLAVCVVLFPSSDGPAFSGWLPAVGVMSAALILGLQVDSPIRRALSTAPLVWLGRISYGVYLFHWPIFVVVTPERTGLGDGPVFLIRIALTLALAQVSFSLFEQPIRRARGLRIGATLSAAAVVTTAVVATSVVVVPDADDDYWAADGVVDEAITIERSDTPLLAAGQAASDPGSAGPRPDDLGLDPNPDSDSEPDPVPAVTGTTDAPDGDHANPASVPFVNLPRGSASPSPTAATPSTGPSGNSTTTTTTTTTPTSTVPPIPPLARPVRIVVAGDSTAEAYGNGVLAWAATSPETAQVSLDVERGCGFVRDGEYLLDDRWFDVRRDCSDWLERDLVDHVARTAPDVVVLITTSWDVLDRRWDGGPGFATQTDEMRARLRADFGQVTDDVLASGATNVVWVKAPIPNPLWFSRGTAQEQPERHAVLHGVMETLAAERPGEVHVVDLIAHFDAAGITDDVDTRPDGVHTTPEASLAIAQDFLGEQSVRAALDLL